MEERKQEKLSYTIRQARAEDVPACYEVYRSLYRTPGCTWDENYPCPEDPRLDFEAGGLYLAELPSGEVIGCITGIPPETWEEDEIWTTLDCWDPRIQNPVDLARLGVKQEYQGQGIARALIGYALEASREKGFDGGIFLVSKENPHAIELYRSLGTHFCGEAEQWDEHWYCCEIVFPEKKDAR
ncbi:MAG: GNAT family N-acetyltransferase [Firmicutes bacterium]|nr:GNAT family N-acetyltransferase [Bacillota bacterium]